jgi:SAM-dependent methyltransferase
MAAEALPTDTHHAQQLSLFERAAHEPHDGREAFRDPAFRDNKSLPIHRWVPWIAGYSAVFVDDVLSAYVPAGKTALVLDPFCGVGTTLLQAVLRGHQAIGFDLNPYPVLATRAKLGAATLNLADLDATLRTIQALAESWRTAPAPGHLTPPPFKSRLPFFSPAIERQVLHALDFIDTITSEPIANLCRVAFGAVMVSFSNYSYEPSLGSRPAAGKPLIEGADVPHILLTKLHQVRADVAQVQAEMRGQRLGTGRVINADFFSAHGELDPGTVDVMVTSPPIHE